MNKSPITADRGLLSRSECHALRGLAILGIFLHNYCHWLGPAVKENEYQFFTVMWRDYAMRWDAPTHGSPCT